MGKRLLVWMCLLIMAVAGPTLMAHSGEGRSVLDDDTFHKKQRAPAVFGHDEHMEMDAVEDCYVCHHLYENGKLVEGESSDDQRCSECHRPDPGDGSVDLMSAYHRRCKGCHEQTRQGPLACGECHIK